MNLPWPMKNNVVLLNDEIVIGADPHWWVAL